MRNSTVLLLAVAAAILAALAFRESRAARQARAALDTAVTERDGLRRQLAQAEEQQQILAAENAGLREAAATAATRPPPDTAPAQRSFNATGARSGRVRPMDVFDSPEVRQLMAVQQKAQLDGRYAGLFRALRLPPDQLERLKQLLVDKQNAPMDVMAAARRQNLLNPAGRSEVDALLQQENETIDAAIRDLLGATAYDEYQDFERTRGPRTVVDQLASRLSYSDAPLTPRQAEALIDLLAAERSTQPASTATDPAATGARFAFNMGPGGSFSVVGGRDTNDVTTLSDAALTGAESVLSDSQLAALRQLQAEQMAQQKMSEMLSQALRPGPAPQTAPATGAWVSAPAETAPRP